MWLRSDIAQVLLSNVQATMNAMAASGSSNVAYVEGYRAAVGSIALAFGISPDQVLPDMDSRLRGNDGDVVVFPKRLRVDA